MSLPTLYRSGAVARMVGMPVATLRVWERRYGLGSAQQAASGHRLYDAADVQRIAMLKRLTSLGHAIGAIVALDATALAAVGATHATTQARVAGTLEGLAPSTAAAAMPVRPAAGGRGRGRAAARRPAGIVVFGATLAHRLRQLEASASGRWVVVAHHDALDDVHDLRDLGPVLPAPGDDAVALLLVAVPSLGSPPLEVLQQLAVVWGAARLGLVYGYGTTSQRAAHAQAGIGLLRTPVDNEALHDGLLRLLPVDEVPNDAASDPRAADHRVDGAPQTGHVAEGPQAADAPAAHLAALLADPPARRYGDAALADFATLSSTIACECPRHVAELVMQLSHFEAYSAGCARRDPADARLHEHLQRVAGTARALFEDALERLAVHEGLVKAP